MKKCLASSVALFFCAIRLFAADVIYDNTDNFQLKVNSTLLESGDQVHFSGESRVIDFFAFEYFATPSVADHAGSARVRFYLNDGPVVTVGTHSFAAPGTLLYDSGTFLVESNSSTVEISGLRLYVPSDTLTWTVQFSNIATNERAGVLFYDPPLVGSSENFLWQRENNEWQPVQASTAVVNNLSARFEALPAFRVRSLRIDNSAVILTVTTTPGHVYSLEYKNSLDQENWTAVEHSSLRAGGTEVTVQDPSGAGAPFRVYRVVEREGTPPPGQTAN